MRANNRKIVIKNGYSKLHEQDVASDTWTVDHNLDFLRPNVQITGSDGKVIIPDEIEWVSTSQYIVTFDGTAVEGFATSTVGGTTILKPNTVGQTELAPEFKAEVDMGVLFDIDWSLAPQHKKTLIANGATITHSNLAVTKRQVLLMTGDFTFTLENVDGTDLDDYDGTLWNMIALYCADPTVASEKISAVIIKTFAV
jgi:hypothetical protein